MAEEPRLSDQYARASPWPLFVALGLVISELGILFGPTAVAVGGLVLFSASIVGILNEAGYATTLWRPAVCLGLVFSALGGALSFQTSFTGRGRAIAVAGVVVLLASLLLASQR